MSAVTDQPLGMSNQPLGTASQPGPSYNREDWASAFVNVELELDDVPLTAVRGEIPVGLNGTLYRNGPGRLERGGQWVHHPFDGDGMVAALRFEQGQLHLRNRYVRTEGWMAEEAAGRMLYRGVFGTQKPGGAVAKATRDSSGSLEAQVQNSNAKRNQDKLTLSKPDTQAAIAEEKIAQQREAQKQAQVDALAAKLAAQHQAQQAQPANAQPKRWSVAFNK